MRLKLGWSVMFTDIVSIIISILAIIFSLFTFYKVEKNKKKLQNTILIKNILLDNDFKYLLISINDHDTKWDNVALAKLLSKLQMYYITPLKMIDKGYYKTDEKIQNMIELLGDNKDLDLNKKNKIMEDIRKIINHILTFN